MKEIEEMKHKQLIKSKKRRKRELKIIFEVNIKNPCKDLMVIKMNRNS